MKNTNKVLGLIPARGGSKGIPRKNVQPICSRPLLAYTVAAAKAASNLDRIIVSTDDHEIASVAQKAGAEVPFVRPDRFATDTASSLSVVQHALTFLAEQEGYRPEAVAVLAPTCPLRTAEQIDATVALFWESDLDTVATIYPVREHPYFMYRKEVGAGTLSELIPLPRKPMRRQELPIFYIHSQSIVVSRSTYLASCASDAPIINFQSFTGLEIDPESALDIDTPTDLLVAEALMQHRIDCDVFPREEKCK